MKIDNSDPTREETKTSYTSTTQSTDGFPEADFYVQNGYYSVNNTSSTYEKALELAAKTTQYGGRQHTDDSLIEAADKIYNKLTSFNH